MVTHEITHGDRTLCVREDGASDGFPVIVHHGTPGCGSHPEPVVRDALRQGVRLLGIDRPGDGGSPRLPGRAVADIAADVRAVADALGFDRFGTFGVSGGGPHALATAAVLGERVTGAVCVAGIAPFDAPGLNYFAGMGEGNLVEFGASLQGGTTLEVLLEEMAAEMASGPDDLAGALNSLLGEEDRAALDAQMASHLAESARIGLAPGIGGWLDDDLAFVRPWGVDVGAIGVPVLVVHGRDDRFVPVAHGEWLAATVPSADVRISSRDGHLSLIRETPAIHAWLLAHSA